MRAPQTQRDQRRSLDDSGAQELLQRILSWFIRVVQVRDGNLVIRKLCSALGAIFLQAQGRWAHTVRQVLCSLHQKQVVDPHDVPEEATAALSLLPSLEQHEFVALLWFSTTLAEEVGQVGAESLPTHVWIFRRLPGCR